MALGDDIKKSSEAIEKLLRDFRSVGIDSENTFRSISDNIGILLKDLQSSSAEAKDLTTEFTTQQKSVKQLGSAASKLSGIISSDLTNRKEINKALSAQRKVESEIAKISTQIEKNKEKIKRAGPEEAAALELQNIYLQDSLDTAKGIEESFKEVFDTTKKINRAGQVFQTIGDSLKTLPGIGPLISKPFENAAAAAREARKEGKSFARSIGEGALELATLTGLLTFAVASFFEADKRTTELAKSLQISKDEAREINKEFINISINSGKAFLNQKNLQEATTELSQQLGIANRLSNDLVENQVFLTKQLGLSADSAADLAELSVLQGKNADKTNKEIANQVAGLQKETGIALKLNDVFGEVSKANGGLKAAYGFNTKLIAEQVVKVKELGLNLEQSAKMASQLLDFESSIAKELEAELLTGKELNLEKARLLALQGKNTEAAAELAKQVGGTAELSRMNVLQQEALAEAMGMERNELIESVQKREVLARLGADSIEQLKEQGRLEELKGSALGDQLLKQYEQESAAAKFESAVIKIQEALGAMMEGPFGAFVDGMANVLASGTGLKAVMVGLGAISLTRMISSLTTTLALNTANASAALTAASAISFGVGLIAIVAAVATAMSAMESATQSSVNRMQSIQDGMIDPSGGLVVSGPRGSIQLDQNDSIIAGTNLIGSGGSNNSSQMMEEQKRTNNFLERLLAKDNSPKVEISAIPGVSYEQRQANNMNTYTTNVA